MTFNVCLYVGLLFGGVRLLIQRGRRKGTLGFISLCMSRALPVGVPQVSCVPPAPLRAIFSYSSVAVPRYSWIGVLWVIGYQDLEKVVSPGPFCFWLLSAFLVPEILDLVGVGRGSYSGPSVSRQGIRTFFPLLLCIPAFFSTLVENSFLVPAIFGD